MKRVSIINTFGLIDDTNNLTDRKRSWSWCPAVTNDLTPNSRHRQKSLDNNIDVYSDNNFRPYFIPYDANEVKHNELINNFAKNNSISIDETIKKSDKKSIDCNEMENGDQNKTEDNIVIESPWLTIRQMILPFIVASMGSVCAGVVLNNVQYWPVFTNIPPMMIMLPAFMGLTGNIETTFASRMSTHSNIGTLDVFSRLRTMVLGSLALVQCQASSAGLFASIVSLAVGAATGVGFITLSGALTMFSSAVLSCLIVNTILSLIITTLVTIARLLRINPDNVATPVAASAGDIMSVTILSNISEFIYQKSLDSLLIPIIILSCFVVYAPIMAIIARRNEYTRSVIFTGWTPILLAVIIEQPGGVVMQNSFSKYAVMSTFQPAVNAVGSNIQSVQSSRLSTFLHKHYPRKTLPKGIKRPLVSPWYAYIKSSHASLLRILCVLVIPVQLLYLIILRFWQNNFVFTAPFLIAYFIAVFFIVFVLLYISYNFVLCAWRFGLNPDNSTIPITSAIADSVSNFSMAAAFTILHKLGDPNAQYVDSTTVANATEAAITTLFNNVTLTHFN